MIQNGVSIYNFGGGGGGMTDGGALVDGDFIQITNNTVSTYENDSRNDINFFFESTDEVLNAIVELSTAVNATVHVYIYDDSTGLYTPLGNIGGDTVNAGDNYQLNIQGNSFSLSQVTGTSDPEYLKLKNGTVTPLLPIGTFGQKKWWVTGNLGDYMYFSEQEAIANSNPNLEFLSLSFLNWINDNFASPRSVLGISGYPGRKYYNDGPYDLNTTFFGFRSQTYGWKCTNDDVLIQTAPGNSGLRYSCKLFYSIPI